MVCKLSEQQGEGRLGLAVKKARRAGDAVLSLAEDLNILIESGRRRRERALYSGNALELSYKIRWTGQQRSPYRADESRGAGQAVELKVCRACAPTN